MVHGSIPAKDYSLDLHSNGRGLFGSLGLPRTLTADFLEFAFADFDTAEVVFESNW